MILRPVAPPVEYGITKRLARAGNAAIAFLRSLGTSAHVWLPGANGVNVASLPSNNYLLSAGSTGYSTVDGVVGLDLDGMGSLGSELVGTYDFTTYGTAGGVSARTTNTFTTTSAGGVLTVHRHPPHPTHDSKQTAGEKGDAERATEQRNTGHTVRHLHCSTVHACTLWHWQCRAQWHRRRHFDRNGRK
jgi:hypothetical protein